LHSRFAFAPAPPVLAPPFGDNMILQREMNVPVWGTDDAGSRIQVTFAG